jgi:outer membrane protein assembly factor BamD (BamD/ComL family)
MSRHKVRSLIFTLVLLACPAAGSWAAPPDRGILAREATIYISPDTTAAKLGTVGRGREVAMLGDSSRGWLHVFASVDRERDITGWILDKGVVRASTPNGDRILFGEAVDSEAQASRRGGRKGAAQDAMRLYARTQEYFPNSPLAGEALYRASDIRWQLDRADIMTRPSARERDPALRPEIPEQFMKDVIKKFPHTKWADMAAFALIDNKLCGEWQSSSKCPEKESEIYEKYATEHPQSPKAPEAVYEAAWRQSALVEIYRQEGQSGKAGQAKGRATALAQRITTQYPQSDWSARAQALIFKVEQNIPTYGSAAE